jgi:hypothetical protein
VAVASKLTLKAVLLKVKLAVVLVPLDRSYRKRCTEAISRDPHMRRLFVEHVADKPPHVSWLRVVLLRSQSSGNSMAPGLLFQDLQSGLSSHTVRCVRPRKWELIYVGGNDFC